MSTALAGYEIVGPTTNVAFLRRLMRCDAFSKADLDTGLIERERAALLPAPRDPEPAILAQAAAAVLMLEATAGSGKACNDPWASRSGWRGGAWLARTLLFSRGPSQWPVRVDYARNGYTAHIGDESVCLAELAFDAQQRRVRGLAGGEAFDVGAVLLGESLHLFTARGAAQFGYAPALAHVGEDADAGGGVTAPMPGKVVAILCEAGKRVERGAPLVVMEAMKMEHTIHAPSAGTVTELLFAIGDQVPEGAALLAFTAA